MYVIVMKWDSDSFRIPKTDYFIAELCVRIVKNQGVNKSICWWRSWAYGATSSLSFFFLVLTRH